MQHPPQAHVPRRTWTTPTLQQLPKLSQLTLQTGTIPGECGEGGGSTCF